VRLLSDVTCHVTHEDSSNLNRNLTKKKCDISCSRARHEIIRSCGVTSLIFTSTAGGSDWLAAPRMPCDGKALGRHFKILKTKRNLFYIRNQSVPRCKHFPPQL
jgi:hypothetical protein